MLIHFFAKVSTFLCCTEKKNYFGVIELVNYNQTKQSLLAFHITVYCNVTPLE